MGETFPSLHGESKGLDLFFIWSVLFYDLGSLEEEKETGHRS